MSQSDLRSCLQAALQSSDSNLDRLTALMGADPASAAQPVDSVRQRLELLRKLSPMLQTLCRSTLGWSDFPIDLVWRLWLPLAIDLFDQHNRVRRPVVQGILGSQGTGKTTLAIVLSRILAEFGLSVCQLSIDDLYKTYGDRQRLQQQDPRLRWRGPPGTHDVDLGLEVLRLLRQGESANLPRFDKSAQGGAGDRCEPEFVASADVILFEGWFVGARPIDSARFETAPWPIVTAFDRAFACDCNYRLQAYLPLWDLLDFLIVLAPIDFRFSLTWRQQAEQQMKGSGRSGMSDAEVAEFVQYFWRSLHPDLFIQPLLQSQADWVIALDAAHQPASISRPRSAIASPNPERDR